MPSRGSLSLPQRKEKWIEADIICALRDLGFFVTKTSQPRPTMLTLGIPDLYAVSPRYQLRVWLEVKRPGKQPTYAQQGWHETERAAGGTVWVVTSVADLIERLKAHIPGLT